MKTHFDPILKKLVMHPHDIEDITNLSDLLKGFQGAVDASTGIEGDPISPPVIETSGWWLCMVEGWIDIEGVSTFFEAGDILVYTESTDIYSRVDAKTKDAQVDITSAFTKLLTGLATQKAVNEKLDKLVSQSASGPTVDDDSADGYFKGCFWITATKVWTCLNAAVGAAEWTDMTAANADQWYGVEWDTAVSSSVCTKIGNTALQTLLPIQAQMKSAVVNDVGAVVYYLHPTDSTKKADGTASVLDGTDGQVMVLYPDHYRKFESDGTKRRVMVSIYPLPGYTFVKGKGVGKYLGYVDGSNVLSSETARMATTSKTRANFRTYGAARGTGWHQISYDQLMDVFILYLTEYADFNSQTKLGNGTTNAVSANWNAYNAYNPVVNTGLANSLGNRSGSVAFTVTDWYKGVTTSAAANKCIATGRFATWDAGYVGKTIKNLVTLNTAVITGKDSNDQIALDADIFPSSDQGFVILASEFVSQCAVYRGIEHIFGHIWSFIDGVNANFVDAANRLVYKCSNPANFADNTATNYTLIGNILDTSGYITKLIEGTLIPEAGGGSSSTYMCDYTYIPAAGSSWRVARWFGSLNHGADAGLLSSVWSSSSGSSSADIGSRLGLTIL